MKLFLKVFLTITCILCLSLSISGYLLVSISFQNTIDRETENTINQYQMIKFSLQSHMFKDNFEQLSDRQLIEDFVSDSFWQSNSNTVLAVFSKDGKAIYSEFPKAYDFSLITSTSNQKLYYEIRSIEEKYILTVIGGFVQNEKQFYLATGTDISKVILQRQQMEQIYRIIYVVISGVSILGALIFSFSLVRPVKKMTRSASRIAIGDYNERVNIITNDELGELGTSFNLMAEAIQNNVEQLNQNAIQKEDFVANFTHELKTPLTSIIGYADMICQKELTREQTKSAGQYILEEGLRLEALSLKLMDLIILNHQEFVLTDFEVKEVLQNIIETLNLLVSDKNIILQLKADSAYIRIEYDLFKTLMLNLIDNAIKADAKKVYISGRIMSCNYEISVIDDGRGIPLSDLNRITEAFYVVDKSRSRKQHGAGIGLSLVARIAEIHNAKLEIKSVEKEGTTVSILLPLEGGTELCEET